MNTMKDTTRLGKKMVALFAATAVGLGLTLTGCEPPDDFETPEDPEVPALPGEPAPEQPEQPTMPEPDEQDDAPAN